MLPRTKTSSGYDGLQAYDSGDAPEAVQPGLEPHYWPQEQREQQQQQQQQQQQPQQQYYDLSDNKGAIAYAQTPGDSKSESERRILGMRAATFWATITAILVAIIVAAVSGGVAGSAVHNSHVKLDQCKASLANLSGAATSNTTGTCPPSSSASNDSAATSSSRGSADTCDDRTVWTSNLTSTGFERFCNYDLDSEVNKTNVAIAVVDSFDLCITMCDAFNFVDSDLDITVMIYSSNGNGTGGLDVFNSPGNCWCVAPQSGYTLVPVTGAWAALKSGSFSSNTFTSG